MYTLIDKYGLLLKPNKLNLTHNSRSGRREGINQQQQVRVHAQPVHMQHINTSLVLSLPTELSELASEKLKCLQPRCLQIMAKLTNGTGVSHRFKNVPFSDRSDS